MNSYIAAATKTRAMYGECLTDADFATLVGKRSVGEIFAYLKNKSSYRRFFSNMNEADVHRGEIENLLWKEISDEYKRMLNFVDSSKSSVLEFWFARREVDYLKHCIRNIYNHESGLYRFENTEELDDFFRKHTSIDVDMCKKAEKLSDFTEAAKGTVYHDVLERAESVEADYFSVAMTLDGLYYKLLWNAAEKYLSKAEQTDMKKYLGSDADMLNIIWIYRGKKYFKFDNKIIYTYLLPVKYKLHDGQIAMLVEAKDADSIADMLKHTPYRHLFDRLDEGYFIEENYRKIRYKTAKTIFRTKPDSIAGLFAYLGLKELEILNITRIIEGVRYDINPEMIKKHVRIG